ncbi:MAG TPA: carbohydrate-binding family 9-like protein [Candidatus Solibacter sp.]|nr:carbohydrate-binding family 9-like protein [Candidatus Solibacter sp.]
MRFVRVAVVGIALVGPVLLAGLSGSTPKNDSAAIPFTISPHPRGYVCFRAAGAVQIDGRLDDPAWQAVPWSEPFVDIEGDAKPKPRFRTRVKMLWDEKYFYVGAELEEPHVWATLTQHDSVIFHDNDLEVFIDPDGDSHEYYEFEINALNTGWDLLLPRPYKDGGRPVDSWEIPGLKTAVHVDGTLNNPNDIDGGWTVELAFPWKVLTELASSKTIPRDGEQWRVNFSRVEWQHEIANGKYRRVPGTKEDNWVWSPQGVIDMHRPESWGYVQFSTAPAQSAEFRPDPTWPARSLLSAIYYAQRQFREKQGCYARTLAELGMQGLRHASLAGGPTLETTENLFEASVALKAPEGGPRRWHIRQDARIWGDD